MKATPIAKDGTETEEKKSEDSSKAGYIDMFADDAPQDKSKENKTEKVKLEESGSEKPPSSASLNKSDNSETKDKKSEGQQVDSLAAAAPWTKSEGGNSEGNASNILQSAPWNKDNKESQNVRNTPDIKTPDMKGPQSPSDTNMSAASSDSANTPAFMTGLGGSFPGFLPREVTKKRVITEPKVKQDIATISPMPDESPQSEPTSPVYRERSTIQRPEGSRENQVLSIGRNKSPPRQIPPSQRFQREAHLARNRSPPRRMARKEEAALATGRNMSPPRKESVDELSRKREYSASKESSRERELKYRKEDSRDTRDTGDGKERDHSSPRDSRDTVHSFSLGKLLQTQRDEALGEESRDSKERDHSSRKESSRDTDLRTEEPSRDSRGTVHSFSIGSLLQSERDEAFRDSREKEYSSRNDVDLRNVDLRNDVDLRNNVDLSKDVDFRNDVDLRHSKDEPSKRKEGEYSSTRESSKYNIVELSANNKEVEHSEQKVAEPTKESEPKKESDPPKRELTYKEIKELLGKVGTTLVGNQTSSVASEPPKTASQDVDYRNMPAEPQGTSSDVDYRTKDSDLGQATTPKETRSVTMTPSADSVGKNAAEDASMHNTPMSLDESVSGRTPNDKNAPHMAIGPRTPPEEEPDHEDAEEPMEEEEDLGKMTKFQKESLLQILVRYRHPIAL